MDAGVVSNFRPQAFASRTAAERFCYRGKATVLLKTLGCRSQGDRRSRLTPFFSSLLVSRPLASRLL